MLPKHHRLPGYLISSTVRNGRQSSVWPIAVFAVKRQQPPDSALFVPRFAVLVPKKAAKQATERNRIKRLVRESVRHLLPTLPFPIDGVVMVKGQLATRSKTEVEAGIKEVFSHLFG